MSGGLNGLDIRRKNKMANHMKEVAKLLGVELEEDFRIKEICSDLLFRITEGR